MSPVSIPFEVPKQFRIDVAAGDVIRRGALLQDAASGRILAHVQETGGLQRLIIDLATSTRPFNPVDTALGIFNVVQNEQIKKRLNVMQGMMSTLQAIQLATLISSFVGIGVTVASTAIILSRLKAISNDLGAILEKIDRLPTELKINGLRSVLTGIETQLERLDEISDRQNPRPVVESVEEKLHEGFNELNAGMTILLRSETINVALIKALLAGLAFCGSAQCKALLWLDDKKTLCTRTRNQIQKLEELAFLMPRDFLERRLQIEADAAKQLSSDASETRMRFTSVLSLGEQLIRMDINGRWYLEYAEQENEYPVLLLPYR